MLLLRVLVILLDIVYIFQCILFILWKDYLIASNLKLENLGIWGMHAYLPNVFFKLHGLGFELQGWPCGIQLL